MRLCTMLVILEACTSRPRPRPLSNTATSSYGSATIRLDQMAGEARVPSYTLTIEGSGRTTFEGRDCTEHPGSHTWQLDPASYAAAIAAFDANHFFQLDAFYPDFETGAVSPFVEISITRNGVTRKVRAIAEFAPPQLEQLQNRLVSITSVDTWFKPWRTPPHERCPQQR
jgi:hypothetical protein